VESGTIDLYGEVKRVQFGGMARTQVRIRDLSRRFEQENYVFEGAGGSFEAALEAAFVDFCKAYPTGRVALLAEAMAPAAPETSGPGERDRQFPFKVRRPSDYVQAEPHLPIAAPRPLAVLLESAIQLDRDARPGLAEFVAALDQLKL
jgi:hypothetical protein